MVDAGRAIGLVARIAIALRVGGVEVEAASAVEAEGGGRTDRTTVDASVRVAIRVRAVQVKRRVAAETCRLVAAQGALDVATGVRVTQSIGRSKEVSIYAPHARRRLPAHPAVWVGTHVAIAERVSRVHIKAGRAEEAEGRVLTYRAR